MYSAFLLFCLAAANLQFILAAGTLKHVVVTYRGQQHTPVDYVPDLQIVNKPEKDSVLTQEGKEDAFKLGAELGKIYGTQLGLNGKWENKYWSIADSTKKNQQSALILVSGLKKDTTGKTKEWSAKELESTEFAAVKQFLKFNKPNTCPLFFKTLREEKETELKQLAAKYASKFAAVMKKYKITQDKMYLLWVAYETFMNQEANKLTIPNEAKSVLGDLEKYSKEMLFNALSTDKLKKISGGRLLDDIMTDLEKKKVGKEVKNSPKGYVASFLAVPQGLVATQLAAFNPKGTKYGGQELNKDTFYPGHGAVHVVELHQWTDGKWKLKVQYRQKEGDQFKSAVFPGCTSELCDFDTVNNAVKNYRVKKQELKTVCGK